MLALSLLFTACEKDKPMIDLGGKEILVSSNTSGELTAFDVSDSDTPSPRTFEVSAQDADGLYYDAENDVLYLADRSNNRLLAYGSYSLMKRTGELVPTATGSSDFTNAREIAFSNGRIVVAQDADASNGNVNALYVYKVSANSISLEKKIIVPINLWGIAFDRNTLYAVQDNSNMLAVFDNFLANTDGSTVMPTYTVQIQGIGRTHGLVINTDDNIAIFTDVAQASSDSDGAFQVITNFRAKLNAARAGNGIIALGDQIRVGGPSTLLGNPVDVAYDSDTDRIYIAERANTGGRLLVFNLPTAQGSGNFAPIGNYMVPGAAGVELANFDQCINIPDLDFDL